MQETTQQPAMVGMPIPRLDGPGKVTGQTRYAGDYVLPGMLHARLVLSPYAHARILTIDMSAALALPGVVAVFTAATLGMTQADPSSRAQTPLAEQEVLWCGHPVAIVVAETSAIAEDAVALVEVDYEPLPTVIDPEVAIQPDSPLFRSISQDPARNGHTPQGEAPAFDLSKTRPLLIGDIEVGLREAEVIAAYTYRTHPVHQSYMEPQSITVAPALFGYRLVIWPSTQGLFRVRTAVATALGIAEREIRVEPVPVGGGFGGKEVLIEPMVAAMAYRLRKPVQLVFTRQDDLLAGNPAPQMTINIKLGAKRDGTLTAIQASMIIDTGAYPYRLAGLSSFLFTSTYRCPNLDVRCDVVQTHKPGTAAYRAPCGPQICFAFEATIQELCQQLEMDPLLFRQINALKEGDPNPFQGRWPRIGLLECIEQIQQHPLWVQRDQAKQDVPAELKGWKIGIGLAVGGWAGGTEPAAALCRMEPDGTFTIVVGSVDISGSDTAFAQIAAEELNLSSPVSVIHGDSSSMPYSGIAAGSKTVYTVGAAVQSAARDARTQMFAIAADMLEASAEDMELRDGKVSVKGVPEKAITLRQIAARSQNYGAPYEPVYGRGRSAIRSASPMFAAHLAKVAVDPETGEVQVLDYVAAQDVGRAINPAEVEGQIAGGVVQGIGWALLEQMVYDENGQALTSTLMDYALPSSQSAPNITSLLVEIPSPLGPFGARGVGEPPVVPVAAAIANAIRDAVGVHMTQLPMTPERVFSSMHERKDAGM